MPAIDIVYLSENLFNKRLLLEKHLASGDGTNSGTVRQQLGIHNRRIDSLLTAFQKTYLVEEESRHLLALKQHIEQYAGQEEAMLTLCASSDQKAGRAIFHGRSSATFQQAILYLNKLTQIQSAVGLRLMKDSQSESSQFNLLSTLQISIAIIIGLLILGLIHNAKIIEQDSQPFHLN